MRAIPAGDVRGVKKPRKSKQKRQQAPQRPIHAGGTSNGMMQGRGPKTSARRAPQAVNFANSRAISVPYDAQDRETVTLLMLPFLLLAFALGLSQTLKLAPATGEIAASKARTVIASHQSPARIPPSPAEATPLRPEQPAVVSRSVAAHDVKIPHDLALAQSAPAVAPTEIALATPAMRLPWTAPEAVAPDPGHDEASFAPAAPQLRRGHGARPPAELCVASPTLGRHVYQAPDATAVPLTTEEFGRQISDAAVAQTSELVIYNDKYRRLSYPMGDVPTLFGVCTDVVIRAFRTTGIDLQELVHKTRVGTGDTSIDHRRTETLRRFFATQGRSLPVTAFPEDYLPGDIVTYHRPQNRRSRSHIAVVTDRIAPSGRPMIVHNRGWGPQLEDGLFVDQITGHYRFAPVATGPVLEAGATAVKRPGLLTRNLTRASFAPTSPAAAAPATAAH